ncbi:cell wall-binding repeat-containing protein [Clostridium sp. A1-XYC3]|uniref:Cell wall-binding repeat-containing protein n=1 Tax=Clostridium tanneri TaxID=3037988 RepID=A0ABU4JTF9_9CLOT|nr:cell wall-binding repeat-containing protein [Clostridium sp. A1-XYC3]MDW8801391.1 cell wall-binding repeat-containing protein [Clostridium sp. A1-XYC3]
MYTLKKILSLIAASILVISISNTVSAKNLYNIKRIFGQDRYKTSVNISTNFGNSLHNAVILASGKDFPDALSGSLLSKKFNGPILLLGNTVAESYDSTEYIKSHLNKNGTIYLLGEQASISDEFIGHFKNLGYSNVVRLGGVNRFETNKIIVNFIDVKKGTPVVIANGYGFADAISISSVAASKQYPILMTDSDHLPDGAKDIISNLQPEQIYLIGGQGSIKDSVVDELKKLVPTLNDSELVRISGNDRYDTSLSISNYFNLETDTAIIANGSNFPDALSGSALAAKLNAPIILTDGQNISNQKSFIESKNYKNLILLGGLASIDLSVEYVLKGADNIKEAEKKYLNSLSQYCESFIKKCTTTSNYIDETFAKVNSVKSISELTTASEISDSLSSLTQIYGDGKTILEKYKEDLIVLKTEVSNLKPPSTLEILKTSYINGIEEELKAVEKLISYFNSYIDLFSSLKDGFSNSDSAKINQKINELDMINKTISGDLKNSQKGELAIKGLNQSLLKIKELIK